MKREMDTGEDDTMCIFTSTYGVLLGGISTHFAVVLGMYTSTSSRRFTV